MQKKWSDVDEYLVHSLIPSDTVFQQILDNNHAAGLPAHDVAPNQGKFLQLLVEITGARKNPRDWYAGGVQLRLDGASPTRRRQASYA
ncbi:Uncharacterised protein [Cedecea neteri]|uniref:Uncharacterized protein n=1 Tax=Cedecea neteri TaxID=158822 RepID=A0A2X3J3C2_9ENTR|nr:Uncharacterised protein [Cedecea neteri]